MRLWQRQEGQLSGASGDKRAEANTDYQLGLAGPLQVQCLQSLGSCVRFACLLLQRLPKAS